MQQLIDLPYGVCFCTEGDLLQQWLEYGDKTKDVCLGFEFDWFEGIKKETPHPSVNMKQACGCYPIIYYSNALENNFLNICHQCIEEHGIQAWVMGIMSTFRHYSAFIKNSTFSGEKEVRIAYYPSKFQTRDDNVMNISKKIEELFFTIAYLGQKVTGVMHLSKLYKVAIAHY